MKKVLFVIAIVASVMACKSEQKDIKNAIENEQVNKTQKKEFIVKMNYKTNKEDEFKLTLNDIEIDEYQSKNILIIEKVSSTSDLEGLTANFGENSSKNFRVNFGNKEVKEIEIGSMSLSYGENTINIIPAELGMYFSFNRYMIQDTVTYKFHTKRIEDKHYPQIILKRKAINMLFEE